MEQLIANFGTSWNMRYVEFKFSLPSVIKWLA